MARLAALAKALYYPTPSRVMDLIASTVLLKSDDLGAYRTERPRLLDPCCGEGLAAAQLATAWGMDAYGVELDAGRAGQAAARMTKVLQGSYHQLQATLGAFSVLFLNPPYDEGQEPDGVSMRQEIQFLSDSIQFLAPRGLLVYVPPRHILRNKAFLGLIHDQFKSIEAWAFPEPEAQAFGQVVVFAVKLRSSGWWQTPELPATLPVLGLNGTYRNGWAVELCGQTELAEFTLKGIAPEAIAPVYEGPAPAHATGAFALPQWDMLVGERGGQAGAPLVRPRPGHQAMLLAAGALNGAEVSSDGEAGGKVILKGSSEKVITTIQSTENDSVIERERIASRLSLLDLQTGAYEMWKVDAEPEKTAQWFEGHGNELARAILDSHTPVFDGDLSLYQADLARLQAPGILPGRSKPEFLQQQLEAAAAVAFRWKKQGRKSAVISGEMGTGKTAMAIVACELAHHRKVVVVCPSHLVSKWIRECEAVTSIKGIAVTAKKLSEVDAFFSRSAGSGTKQSKARYLVLSKEMAKLGARWRPAILTRQAKITREVQHEILWQDSWGRIRGSGRYETIKRIERRKVVLCPACGAVQESNHLLLLPESFDEKLQRACTNKKCKQPLWQATPITSKGTRRWPLARYINRHYAGRYALVIDECHQFAKAESDQSRAIIHLASGATKILAMTGALYGGRASSLFHLLYLIDYDFRQAYQHNECSRFVEHHGLFETKYDEQQRTSVYGYRKGRSGGRVREIPGMSPAMIPLLLPFTIFVKLKDLRLELPPYSEHVELLDHDGDVEAEAKQMGEDVQEVLRKHPRILGQYLMACLGYPDCPEQAESIVDRGADGEQCDVIASAKAFAEDVWPKDQRVVEIVQEEKAAGRTVLVYCAQTHRRDPRPRLRRALEAARLRVEVLDSNVAAEKREEWLAAAVKRGFDVLLTNGKLVETGMDLLFAHTIVQYGIEYSIPTLRQSIRRSWRLGQKLPVKVIFLAYARTMQAVAMNLIARKMRAAEMVDGDENGGLAQFDEDGGNFFLELAQGAVSCAVGVQDGMGSVGGMCSAGSKVRAIPPVRLGGHRVEDELTGRAENDECRPREVRRIVGIGGVR